MSRQKKHIITDLVLIVISVCVAFILAKYGIAEQFVNYLSQWRWVGILTAGMLFTSFFTTASSIVLIGYLAAFTPIWELALIGGIGATLGDYGIFYFVKSRITADINFLLSHNKKVRITKILHTRLIRFFVPLVGALIIASPFPDEIGITILGLSKIKDRYFLPISFVMNAVGIMAIAWISILLAQ